LSGALSASISHRSAKKIAQWVQSSGGIVGIAILAVLALGMIWAFVFMSQERDQEDPAIQQIATEKFQEAMETGFDGLVSRLGQGYAQGTVIKEGRAYRVGYVVSRPPGTDGFYAKNSRAPLQPGETVEALEIIGRINPVSLMPSLFFKKEFTFKTLVTREKEAA